LQPSARPHRYHGLSDKRELKMIESLNPGDLRRQFRIRLFQGLRVVWPILIALLACIASLGIAVALLEGWSLFEGVYFAFVSGLTIGYGDLAPKGALARTLAIGIGFLGILLGGLVAAVGVNALNASHGVQRAP
jgi:hypothetical protein